MALSHVEHNNLGDKGTLCFVQGRPGRVRVSSTLIYKVSLPYIILALLCLDQHFLRKEPGT